MYTADWKEFIKPNLSQPGLKNHSLYGSFQLRKENEQVLFRGKRYAYEKEWRPECGIRLLKDNTEFLPVRAAPFNMELLKLDLVFSHLQTKLYPLLNHTDLLSIQQSWDGLRQKLENLDRNWINLPKLKLQDLKTQTEHAPRSEITLPESLGNLVQEEAIPDLAGHLASGTSASQPEVMVGQDLVIWTDSKTDR